MGQFDSVMTLGVKPVGAVEAIEGAGYPKYLEGTEGIENVGSIEQPNLEKIASLDPDLILSSELRHEAVYEQLSEIAPTVFTETTGVTWKENFKVHAEALGRTEEAGIVKKEYQARVDEFRRAMGENPPEVSVCASWRATLASTRRRRLSGRCSRTRVCRVRRRRTWRTSR